MGLNQVNYTNMRDGVMDRYWLAFIERQYQSGHEISTAGFWEWFYESIYTPGSRLDEYLLGNTMKTYRGGESPLPEPNCTISGHSHRAKDCPIRRGW